EDVVAEQIRLLLDGAKIRLDAAEDAHDALVDTIMDEEEIVKEEEWLGGVVNDFNKVTRLARKILGEVGATPVKPGINMSETQVDDNFTPAENVNVESVQECSNDNANVDSSVNNVETQSGNVVNNAGNVGNTSVSNSVSNVTQENSLISMVQAMALPKAQVKKFDGDPLFYHSFIATFTNSVSCILDPSVKLNVLRSLCCGRALDSTEYCVLKPPAEGLQSAMKTLKERFGNSALIVQAWVQKIVARPKVEPSKLEGYADDLSNCFQALDALGYLHELSNQGSLKTIIEKLPRFLQQRWTREVFKLRESNQIPSLKDVVKFVRSASCEINDPVF
ncbi:uncharacterized protein LOC117114352, partial [Anneissia japonica]|uniref:uncharacterized protein LOC117114352 n=1 Tax=Anneissia japonica TaxID=1529436 RepID=UPI0014257BB6